MIAELVVEVEDVEILQGLDAAMHSKVGELADLLEYLFQQGDRAAALEVCDELLAVKRRREIVRAQIKAIGRGPRFTPKGGV